MDLVSIKFLSNLASGMTPQEVFLKVTMLLTGIFLVATVISFWRRKKPPITLLIMFLLNATICCLQLKGVVSMWELASSSWDWGTLPSGCRALIFYIMAHLLYILFLSQRIAKALGHFICIQLDSLPRFLLELIHSTISFSSAFIGAAMVVAITASLFDILWISTWGLIHFSALYAFVTLFLSFLVERIAIVWE